MKKEIEINASSNLEATQIQQSLQIVCKNVSNEDIIKIGELIEENPKLVGNIVRFIKNPPALAKPFLRNITG